MCEDQTGNEMKTKKPSKPKKLTKLAKAKAAPNSRYWRNKADAAWSRQVRKAGRCAVCGTTKNLQAHHLISRWVPQLRHDIMNGVCLCPLHHKWGKQISAHQSPMGLAWTLMREMPDAWRWLMQTFQYWDDVTAMEINYQKAYNELCQVVTVPITLDENGLVVHWDKTKRKPC